MKSGVAFLCNLVIARRNLECNKGVMRYLFARNAHEIWCSISV
nr:MAG TPA: hypothetical protein [Caudoviricetes sp.]